MNFSDPQKQPAAKHALSSLSAGRLSAMVFAEYFPRRIGGSDIVDEAAEPMRLVRNFRILPKVEKWIECGGEA